jgi:2-amino-4-hydroxy-6-hydroxymethyldihydropteridine diphosphokinase
MHKVYLSLGANIGNRKRAMRQAIEKLDELVGSVVCQSELYETKPWGFESPNDFINCCVLVDTPLSPRQLLETTQHIERELGRVEKTSSDHEYHDRVIDIDILLYDDIKVDEPDLKIPHPLMYERDFVMTPLKEIMK